jgi:hypothetical protein
MLVARGPVIAAALVGLLANPSFGAGGAAKPWLIAPGIGIGPVLLGATPAEVREHLGKPGEIHERTYVYPGGLRITFEQDDRVRAIYLSSGPDFTRPVPFSARTAEGIGFGNTRAEVDAWLGKSLRVVPMAGARGIEGVESPARGIFVTPFEGKLVEFIVVPAKPGHEAGSAGT